jgi:hypothetical protein
MTANLLEFYTILIMNTNIVRADMLSTVPLEHGDLQISNCLFVFYLWLPQLVLQLTRHTVNDKLKLTQLPKL